MPDQGKITGGREVLCGILAGFMIFGGAFGMVFFQGSWNAIGWIALGAGVLTLLDDAFPHGRQPHLTSEGGGFIAGSLASWFALTGGLLVWILLLGVAVVIMKMAGELVLRGLGFLLRKIRNLSKTFKPKGH